MIRRGDGEAVRRRRCRNSSLMRDTRRMGRCVCARSLGVAAMSVAKRVADEMDVNIGEEVGYSIRLRRLDRRLC